MFLKKIKQLESRYSQWGIQNIATYIIAVQAIVYVLMLAGFIDFQRLFLIPSLVALEGEYWRLVTFLFIPPVNPSSLFGVLFLLISWYIFFIISATLEQYWGTVTFNIYIYICVLCTALSSLLSFLIFKDALVFVKPDILFMSLFLAFAMIRPNLEFLLFFIIPMKVKYLALLSAAFFFLMFLSTSLSYKLIMIAQILNFFLFFVGDFVQYFQQRKRVQAHQKELRLAKERPLHTCTICGATDKTHPNANFRYRNENNQLICICDNCRELND